MCVTLASHPSTRLEKSICLSTAADAPAMELDLGWSCWSVAHGVIIIYPRIYHDWSWFIMAICGWIWPVKNLACSFGTFWRSERAFQKLAFRNARSDGSFFPITYGSSNSPIMTLQPGFQVGLVSGLLSNHPNMTQPSEYMRDWIPS